MNPPEEFDLQNEIAIIGMACRFPGAKNVHEYWRNLQEGVETISFFSEKELEKSGLDPDTLRKSNYVKAAGILDEIEFFDASFFGFNPREAEMMDPQHRFFLESCWEAFEHAGYSSPNYKGTIGVFGGSSQNVYFTENLLGNHRLIESFGNIATSIGNDTSFVSTLVSYKLNLRGPSVNVQTACSTSLVAVHLACQSLLNGECDMVLAGGVSVITLKKQGYFYQKGGVFSPDGHCRAFDEEARGMVGGDGVGIVVLKRLEEALEDGDYIHSIIKGSAINNDGALKVGFTAPSVEGQARVIAEALAISGVNPRAITYVETHGTGTVLGDPIEITALKQSFKQKTDEKGFCAIGSVKTNIGHTNASLDVIQVPVTLEMKGILGRFRFIFWTSSENEPIILSITLE